MITITKKILGRRLATEEGRVWLDLGVSPSKVEMTINVFASSPLATADLGTSVRIRVELAKGDAE